MQRKALLFLLIIFILSACTRSLAQVPSNPPSATATPTLSFSSSAPPPLPPYTPITPPTFGGGTGTYAIILVAAEDELSLHSGPGLQNPVVGTLQALQTGVTSTGQTVGVGEDVWVEIHSPSGGVGWVDSKNLTEYVTQSSFCEDANAVSLLRNLELAVNTLDGEMFSALVSPAHGLDVAYIRDAMLANYSPEEASWAFLSSYRVDWGPGAGGGEFVSGTFPEIILPALQDVFKNLNTSCNEVKLGGATYLVEWPQQYTNINYYSLHNPGNDPSFDGLDWSTWLAGIEYVNGQPYLFSLLHYQWEP